MPKIYDNIHIKFADGLAGHLQTANRVDYCVGYFNLRGWSVVTGDIDSLAGGMVYEGGAAEGGDEE
ncbi:MAG: hypothetical protein LBL26_02130 [Peptococcaceae bacterium]|jgi:hypothetical protein|nr:hypothetical protein [Peptococcaceae bacterium]